MHQIAVKIGSLIKKKSTPEASTCQCLQTLRAIRQQLKTAPGQKRKIWTLVIGTHQAGKTTLINQQTHQAIQVPTTQNGDFPSWVSQTHVFIEADSKYLDDPSKQAHWPTIAKTIKRYQRRCLANQIIVAINIHTLLSQSSEERIAQLTQLQCAVQHYCAVFNLPCQVNLAFTHMDCIAGFHDYFAHANQTEAQRPLTLPGKHYEKAYSGLLQTLHRQTITLLQHTRNPDKRQLISEFPLQMEAMQQYCLQAITLLGNKQKTTPYHIEKIFFTSARTQGPAFDLLAAPIEHHYQINPTTLALFQPEQPKSYLTDAVFQLAKENTSKQHNTTWFHYSTLLLALLVIGYSGYLLFDYYGKHVNPLHQTIKNIHIHLPEQLFESRQETMEDILELVQSTKKMIDDIDVDTPWLGITPWNNIQVLRELPATIYQDVLYTKFIPHVMGQLAKSLQQPSSPETLYTLLKNYLMLAEPSAHNKATIIDAMAFYWQGHPTFNEANIQQLINQLSDALEAPRRSQINHHLVQQARQQLRQLSPAELLYLRLQSDYQPKQQVLSLPHFTAPATLPYLYTQQGALGMMQQHIAFAVRTHKKTDWILGRDAIPIYDRNLLTQQVVELYIEDYRDWWQTFIKTAKPKDITTLSQSLEQLAFFAANIEPMTHALSFISENTAPLSSATSHDNAFNRMVANRFSAARHIRVEHIQAIQPQLAELYHFLLAIARQPNSHKAALDTVKQGFSGNLENDPFKALLTSAKAEPEPLRQWLTATAEQSWQALINHASGYVNQQWQLVIHPYYQRHIANRYPLQFDSDTDINLDSFNQFFGKNGHLHSFLEAYLAPFIDTSKTTWQLKKTHRSSLPLTPRSLQMLQLADFFQQMFFDLDSNELTVNFKVKALSFNENVGSVKLSIHGQDMFDYPGNQKTTNIAWPVEKDNKQASLIVLTSANQEVSLAQQGDWAWLRLFTQAKTAFEREDKTTYQFNFQLDNDVKVSYQITADHLVNPFIPNIFSYFTLPEDILRGEVLG